MSFLWTTPVKVTFGPDALNDAGEVVKQYGHKAMIMTTGPFFTEIGLVPRLQKILKESGVDSVSFTEVPPNPTTVSVDVASKVAMDNNCDVVIGLGGGSAIDSAKGVAIAAGHRAKIWDFSYTESGGQREITSATLPIVAITTTSGTGSHMTQYVVITNPETKEKPGFGCDFTYAHHAIVDPKLMIGLPKKMTAATGFDVVCHAIEGYTSKLENLMCDVHARAALRLAGKYLRTAVNDGSNLEARTYMALADTLAGISIAMGGVTSNHATAHAAGGLDNVIHGEYLAASAPVMYAAEMRSNPTKFRELAGLLNENFDPTGKSEDELLQAGMDELNALRRDIGLDVKMGDIGIVSTAAEIAQATFDYMGGSLDLDYLPQTKESLTELLKKAY